MLLKEKQVEPRISEYAYQNDIIISSEARVAIISTSKRNDCMSRGKKYVSWTYKGTISGNEIMIVLPVDDVNYDFITHLFVNAIEMQKIAKGKSIVDDAYALKANTHTYETIEDGVEIDYEWYDLEQSADGLELVKRETNLPEEPLRLGLAVFY